MQNTWNKFYQKHGRFYLTPHTNISTFIHLAQKRNLKKILDLGCGSGRHLVKLAQKGFKVYGIDFSPSACQLAEQWLHQYGLDGEIIVADFEDKIKEYEDNSFDGIIAINSLESGPLEQFEQNLKQINNLLKQNGLFWIVYPSKESSIKNPTKQIRLLTLEEFKNYLSNHFKIIFFDIDKQKNFVSILSKKTFKNL